MILETIFTVLRFIGVLLVLVLVHEWGHFFAARRFGVKVHEFGFGFPPRLAKWLYRGTEYTVNLIPLGGFVRLKGEDGSDAAETDSFAHKKAWQRLVILLAGVVMNFILGYFLYVIVLSVGTDMPVQAAGRGAVLTNQRVIIANVLKGSPADTAGLRARDEVIKIDGASVDSASDLREHTAKFPTKDSVITVNRDGAEVVATARPVEVQPGVTGFGVHIADIAHARYGFPHVFVQAGRETYQISTLIFKTLGSILGGLISRGELQEGVSGPVGIAVVTSQVARTGLMPFLEFVAMLSINLGILNVLPFPALDGGRAIFVLLEKITRKRVRIEIERYAHLIGFLLLMALVIAVTYRDIIGLIK